MSVLFSHIYLEYQPPSCFSKCCTSLLNPRYRYYEPDGVFLDVNMPVMDGITTLHELLKLDPETRVALVTYSGSQSIILGALKIGARDCLDKPLDDRLIVTIANRLVSPVSFGITAG